MPIHWCPLFSPNLGEAAEAAEASPRPPPPGPGASAGLLPLGPARVRWAPHQLPYPGQAESGRVPEEWWVGIRAQLQEAVCRTLAEPARPRTDGE